MKKVYVNIGCGTNLAAGFVNVDVVRPSNADKSFVEGDALHLPFKDASVDYIIMDQVLEHIAMADVPLALHEVRRVLKKGGRAVIVVPDFRSAAQDWLALNHDGGFDPFLHHYVSEVIYGNQQHEGEYHKTPMSAGFLHYALCMVGLPKHELTMFTKFADPPRFPGMREVTGEGKLRNAQLVADIIKS